MMHFTGVSSAARAVAAGTSAEAALASNSSRRVTITLSTDRYWAGEREARMRFSNRKRRVSAGHPAIPFVNYSAAAWPALSSTSCGVIDTISA